MDFQSEKSFEMLGTMAFQPYHQILYVDSVDRVDITVHYFIEILRLVSTVLNGPIRIPF